MLKCLRVEARRRRIDSLQAGLRSDVDILFMSDTVLVHIENTEASSGAARATVTSGAEGMDG